MLDEFDFWDRRYEGRRLFSELFGTFLLVLVAVGGGMVNARFGGGYPLAHHAGARFADWLLDEIDGRPCRAHDGWREGVTMLRYDDAVFLG